MTKNNELVFILDQSGSMYGKEEDTAGSVNAVLAEQKKKEDYNVLVTTVLFSNDDVMIHDRTDAKKIADMKKEDIHTSGSTALYDAVGKTIEHIEFVHKYIREEDRPEHVLVVIITDGMENASRKYTNAKIRAKIDAKKEQGWEFVFLGADIDAEEQAEVMHIEPQMAVSFRKESGLKERVMGNSLNRLAAMIFGNEEECDEWREELDEDFRRQN